MTDYHGPERRLNPACISEELVEEIAEKAADRAVQKLTEEAYKAIGKGVVSKFLTILGIVTVAAYLWFNNHGFVK